MTNNRAKKPADRTAALQAQLDQLTAIIDGLSRQLDDSRRGRSKTLRLLESVSVGLYDEIDKLTKKAPAETVTELALGQLNDAIREARRLIVDDPFVQRLKEFVPAGDNPEHRDALIVLRQIRQGLERFRVHVDDDERRTSALLREAQAVRAAIQYYLAKGSVPDKDGLEDSAGEIPSSWLRGPYPGYFNLDKLSNIDLSEHFSVE